MRQPATPPQDIYTVQHNGKVYRMTLKEALRVSAEVFAETGVVMGVERETTTEDQSKTEDIC